MIKNFDEIKQQLQELAPVINSFKSETVQLRVIELIFRGEGGEGDASPSDDPVDESPAKSKPKRRKTRSKARPKSQAKDNAGDSASKSAAKGGTGAHASVSGLLDEGFFKKAQTIRSIIDHLGTNKGRHFKANQISPSLLRLLREDKLKRTKNADNQYEYSQA